MHTPEYIQSRVPDSPVIGQNWLSVLIVHPLQGLSDGPDLAGQTVLLTSDHTTLGRHASCQAQIKDGYISRVHATVHRKPATKGIIYEIHDGDLQGKPSSNGLLVNGEKLQASALLEDGDWLQLGTRLYVSFHEVRIPTPSEQREDEILSDLLIEAGLVTPDQVQSARAEKQQSPLLLGEILVQQQLLPLQTLEFMRQIDRITLPLPVSSPPLGEYLKAAGLVTETQIQTALQTQKRSRIFFGNALVRQGVIQDATLNFFMKMYQHLDSSLQSTVSADRVLDDMSA